MVTKELSEAAVEFNCILTHSSQEIINKIPEKFVTFMKSIASTTYTFNYDKSKKLNEQNIKPETRGIISLVYQDYICSEEEKNNYILKCENYEIKKENELKEKYNPDNIFNKSYDNNINDSKDEVALVETKNEVWYRKIVNFFKRIFLKH